MAQIFADLVLISHSAGCLLDGRESEGLEEKERQTAAYDDEKENG